MPGANWRYRLVAAVGVNGRAIEKQVNEKQRLYCFVPPESPGTSVRRLGSAEPRLVGDLRFRALSAEDRSYRVTFLAGKHGTHELKAQLAFHSLKLFPGDLAPGKPLLQNIQG